MARAGFAGHVQASQVPLAPLTLMCAMGGVFVMGAMMHGLPDRPPGAAWVDPVTCGFVISAVGFGGCIGQFAMPAMSDLIGRKLATLASYILAAVFTVLLHPGRGGQHQHAVDPAVLRLAVQFLGAGDPGGSGGSGSRASRHAGLDGRLGDLRRRDHRRRRGPDDRRPDRGRPAWL